jgi:carbonic anhydrase
MEDLISGVHTFRKHVFPAKRTLFRRLSKGQDPCTLFITCSDSRILPNLFTQTEPGDLFIIRNAGNLIPPHPVPSGAAATVEFAVRGLGIKDIIVCGHTNCGAMCQLVAPKPGFPLLDGWLEYAAETRTIMQDAYSHLSEKAQLKVVIKENVLVQLEHLRSLPVVAEAIENDNVKLHGWVYDIETGEVLTYNPQTGQFAPLIDDQE